MRLTRVLTGQFVTYLAQVVTLFLTARLIGPAAQGDYAILRTAVFLGETLMWFGLNTGLGYLIASDPDRYHDPLLKLSILYLGAVAVALPAALGVLNQLQHPQWIDPILAHAVPFVTWLVTHALLQLLLRVFVAKRRFDFYNGVNLLNSLALFPTLMAAGWLRGLTLDSLALASAGANVVALAVAIWHYRHGFATAVRKPLPGLPVFQKAYGVGIKAYLSTLAFLALYRLDFFFVAHFLGAKALGIYTVGVFAIEAMQKVPEWLGLMLTPVVAADPVAAQPRTHRYAWLAVSAVTVVAVPIVALRGWHDVLLRHTLGEAYAGVGGVVLLLLPKAVLHAVMVIYAAYLAGRGYTRYHPLAGATALAVLILLDLALIPRFGLPGAVMSVSLAYVAATSVVLLGYRQQAYRLSLQPAA